MSLIRSISLFIGLVFCQVSFAQQAVFESEDLRLTKRFEEMISSEAFLRYDSLAPAFKKYLTEVLNSEPAFKFPFDSLRTKLNLVETEDGKVRIFSWDEKSGGTYHDMAAVVQYESADGDIEVQELDSGDVESFDEVVIHEDYQLSVDGEMCYLTIGWGTYGGGHQHISAQIYRIHNSSFIRTANLLVEAPRREKINLIYDKEKREIKHNEFVRNMDIGFYEPTGNTVTWKVSNGTFEQ